MLLEIVGHPIRIVVHTLSVFLCPSWQLVNTFIWFFPALYNIIIFVSAPDNTPESNFDQFFLPGNIPQTNLNKTSIKRPKRDPTPFQLLRLHLKIPHNCPTGSIIISPLLPPFLVITNILDIVIGSISLLFLLLLMLMVMLGVFVFSMGMGMVSFYVA